MANLKLKDIKQLETWNAKELRKLRMTIKNRISSFQSDSKPKDLTDTHPLFEMEEPECASLLDKVLTAERKL
jgi:hypothetical protein